jgi:hypothetical protein
MSHSELSSINCNVLRLLYVCIRKSSPYNFLDDQLNTQFRLLLAWNHLGQIAISGCFGSPKGEGWACRGSSAIPRPLAWVLVASYRMDPHPWKIRLISWGSMSLVSDIKLIRTDTTLVLSQKAEKGMPSHCFPPSVVSLRSPYPLQTVWDSAACCFSSPPSAFLLSTSAPGFPLAFLPFSVCHVHTTHREIGI